MNSNVNTLKVRDAGYPDNLRHMADPPAQIYWAGKPPASWINRPRVAIVGSRKLTAYGRAITDKLAGELAAAGVVIISGLAYGIDVTAHLAALKARGTTVAVLPSGLDQIYPAAHLNIARQITEQGSLVTEYAPGSIIAFKSNFIARNRIISGLADAVLIPEAALKSGSLHTARFAMEQGKAVLAVPGNITSPASEGCNNLIKNGAIPVTSADDVFFALKISPADKSRIKRFVGTPVEEKVYSLIKEGFSDQEQLATVAELDSPTLSSTLTMLEISGHVRAVGAGNWIVS
jgi:DNA processing protein